MKVTKFLIACVCLAGCFEGADVPPPQQGEVVQAAMSSYPKPARTLYVATSWSGTTDPLINFTTIPAAETQAAGMTPTVTNPVSIIVYPGTYSANVTLMSNVNLTGTATPSVVISGTVGYSPGVGVNAVFATDSEIVAIRDMTLNGAITIDGTGKASNTSTIVFRDDAVNGAVTGTGRSATGADRDQISYFSCGIGAGAHTYTTTHTTIFGSRYHGITFNGASLFSLSGGDYAANAADSTSVNGTSSGTVEGLNVTRPWSIASGASTTFAGCTFSGSGTLTVASGGTADVRASQLDASKLIGAGIVSRKATSIVVGPTAAGANGIVFLNPFPDANYNATLQLTGGPGGAAYVGGKTDTGFTLTETGAGGNTYDVVVTHD